MSRANPRPPSSGNEPAADRAQPAPTDRYFFAIFPDAAAADRIARLAATVRGQHGLSSRLQDRERLHLTLHLIGDFHGMPHDLLDRVRAAAATVQTVMFDLRFDTVASFARRRQAPLVLRSASPQPGLLQLRESLLGALRTAGLARDQAAYFVPHVTLLYDDLQLPPQPVEPVVWTVREFVLVHSFLGQHRYEYLDRFALAGRADGFV
jgi:2'-5' RNA ligase